MNSIFDDAILVNEINAGSAVCCDGCNGPYDENKMNGGVIIGSSAYCQECSDRYGWEAKDYEYADEVTEVMDKDKTFEQNVLDYREKMTGSTNAISRIYAYSTEDER